MDEIKTRFFTNISQEFRTPLTLILGPAKQLSEQLKDEQAKIKADLIHRSAKNLNRLVDELLDISKIESGEMKLKACPLNLVKIVKESALSFSSLAERRKITFNINSTVDELIAYVDRNKVDKILSNILSNAFKFTPEMGKVEVDINKNEKFAEIIITDTGIGIPENQIDKIFDRFYQVYGSHTREHEGTGIGLALTKELAELHKGRIEVESKEGKGSKFKIMEALSTGAKLIGLRDCSGGDVYIFGQRPAELFNYYEFYGVRFARGDDIKDAQYGKLNKYIVSFSNYRMIPDCSYCGRNFEPPTATFVPVTPTETAAVVAPVTTEEVSTTELVRVTGGTGGFPGYHGMHIEHG